MIGLYIVNKKKKWMNEEQYEILADTSGQADGPRKSRLLKASGKHSPLLSGYKVYFHGKFTWVNDEMDTLFKLSGLKSLKSLKGKPHDKNLVVICENEPSIINEIRSNYNLDPIHSNWIFDCIGNFTVLPFEKYILDKN